MKIIDCKLHSAKAGVGKFSHSGKSSNPGVEKVHGFIQRWIAYDLARTCEPQIAFS